MWCCQVMKLWQRALCLCLLCYIIVCLSAYVYDVLLVRYDIRQWNKKDFYDGPLIVKDLPGSVDLKLFKDMSIFNSDQRVILQTPRPVVLSPPRISLEFFKLFDKTVKRMSLSIKDFLLLTIINREYRDLILNWLCNVVKMKSNLHSKLILVSTDRQICDVVQKEWRQVHCIHLPVDQEYNKALGQGRRGYMNLLNMRAQLMHRLTKTDSVWLRDPISFFHNQTLIDDADLVVPVKGYPQHGLSISFDPMIVYATNASEHLFAHLTQRLNNDTELFDQDVLDELCKQMYHGVICRRFEWEEVADGKWFKLSDNERNKLKPFIVNNNYYVGVENKISRQALNGLWFLNAKKRCLVTKVDKILKKYQ